MLPWVLLALLFILAFAAIASSSVSGGGSGSVSSSANELLTPQYSTVILEFNDVITTKSHDPFYLYDAKQTLLDHFTIETKDALNLCLNESCQHRIKVPSSSAFNAHSVFVIENFAEYASIPFKITVEAKIPIGVKQTMEGCKSLIKNGTLQIWFDTTEKIKREFMLYVGDTFIRWSGNQIDPDIECVACDKVVFRVVPRHVAFSF